MPLVLFALLFLACVSCTHSSNWSYDQIHSHREDSSSSKLTYHPPNFHNGINLEFLKTQDQLKGYLIVHSTPVSDKEISITYIIDGNAFHSEGYCLKGGQRIRLNETCSAEILEALAAGKTVSFALENYRSTISPEGLAAPLKKFQKPAAFPELIHLPF